MIKTITAKGKRWELFHSIWMLWTLVTFGFFNYVSFFYIAYRVKQKKWTISGIIYAIPFINFMIISESVSVDHGLYNLATIIYLVAWIISIFHVFRIRPEYLLRLEAYKAVENKDIEQMRRKIANEYGKVASENYKENKIIRKENIENTVSNDMKNEVKEPINVNTASENEIASIPHIGIIMAKKVISKREEIGSFTSIEHFGEQIGLKPHLLERVRPYIKVSQIQRKKADEQAGRIVDL